METIKDLQELIQDDIITCCCAYDHNLEGSELVDNLCQIVVDRIKNSAGVVPLSRKNTWGHRDGLRTDGGIIE